MTHDPFVWPKVADIDETEGIPRSDCGSVGVGPGACGLYAAIGDVHLMASLEAAKTLQARGTFGAGVLLRGIYPKRKEYYAFHVLYRNRSVANELEPLITDPRFGMRHYGEMEPLVAAEFYRKYDLPTMRRYFMAPPTQDEMMLRKHTASENDFVRRVVEDFNQKQMGDARIFSCGKDLGVFITAMGLAETMEVFDLEQFASKPINAVMTHMRWPTSIAASGVWWGVHPIALLGSAIVHNGDLSSSASNNQGLDAACVRRTVGTDSEAMLLEIDDLMVRRGLSYAEAEWVMCRKFPRELSRLDADERSAYERLVSDPVLSRYKMSGPSSFVALVGNRAIAGRDRDGLRQLWMGRSDDGKTVIWGSEEKVIYQSAWLAEKNFNAVNCEPGRLIAYEIGRDGSLDPCFGERL